MYLKGITAKNSFFLGLAKGYCDKISALKKDYTSPMNSALMVLEKQLIDAKEMAYPHLSTVKRSARFCPESAALGEQMGKQLNIHPAVKNAKEILQIK